VRAGFRQPSDGDLLFLQQLGADYVSVASTPDLRTAEGFLQIKKRYAHAGIAVWNIGNSSVTLRRDLHG
jgi:mannonate dehydratase